VSTPSPEELRPEEVLALKNKLKYMGYFHGRCNGVADDYLDRAIEQFYRANKFKAPVTACDILDAVTAAAGDAFADVLADELKALRATPTDGTGAIAQAHRNAMAGLAFSGGGIRSATFNLGILQALAEARVLRHFDYLSTVSGGGYIGGWLAKWIHKKGDVGKVEEQLAQSANGGLPRREPSQVTFLRQYSNYLTPRAGLFTADTWTFLATYLRNTILNLLILSLFLAALLIVPRLWVSIVLYFEQDYKAYFLGIGALAFLVAVHNIAFTISCRPKPASRYPHGQAWVLWRIVLALIVAAMFGSVGLWWVRGTLGQLWSTPDWPLILLAPGIVYFFAWATGWDRAQYRNQAAAPGAHQAAAATAGSKLASLALKTSPLLVAAAMGSFGLWWVRATANTAWSRRQWPLILLTLGVGYFISWVISWDKVQRNRASGAAPPTFRERLRARLVTMREHGLPHLFCAVGAFAVGAALIVTAAVVLEERNYNLTHVVSFGVPLLLAIFGITMVIMIGLVGRHYSEQSREWWSRQGGWTFICVIASTALFLFSIYSPALMMWVVAHLAGWGSALLTSGWLGTVWATLRAARSPGARPGKSRVLSWIVRVGPVLVMAWALAGIATAIYLLLPHYCTPALDSFASILETQLANGDRMDPPLLLLALLIAATVGATFSYRADVNKFSLYMMYRNRLVRAYLGAIDVGRRRPHPFTGFAPEDDIPLAQLDGAGGQAQRPYLIVNAAVNLVKGNELAWQTRKAANFVFTSRYCGFETPIMPVSDTAGAAAESARGGFRPTAQYGAAGSDPDNADKGVKLGMAMAISGAAVASSMGSYSSAPLAFVMTLFNVRLGRWCGNPGARDDVSWRRASPPAGVAHLFRELLGFTDAGSSFLYLSDGGHFENLGIYELVRRRCRLIVAIDAGADPERHFGDLGNAIRKCYTDFHIDIDINADKLKVVASTGLSRAYYIVGKIRYGSTDPNAPDGTLIYIKPSLCGNELAAITNYHLTNPEFPHQSTADQWFDEMQFESYRSLGQHIGNAVFGGMGAAAGAADGPAGAVEQLCRAFTPALRKPAYPWWHVRRWL
jgi:hypothetical protein